MSSRKSRIFTRIGYALCVLPPLAAIFLCFPVWIRSGSAETMSGIALVLCILSAMPFIKRIAGALRSPSVFVVWLIVCVTFTLIRAIIDQMLIVSYVALISNTLGALFFRLAGTRPLSEGETTGKAQPGERETEAEN